MKVDVLNAYVAPERPLTLDLAIDRPAAAN
jgi:hypothetical protein